METMVVQVLEFTSYNINVASSYDGLLHLLGLSMPLLMQNIHHQIGTRGKLLESIKALYTNLYSSVKFNDKYLQPLKLAMSASLRSPVVRNMSYTLIVTNI